MRVRHDLFPNMFKKYCKRPLDCSLYIVEWGHCRAMATKNVSEDLKQKGVEQLLCQASTASAFNGQLTFLSVLNSLLSITAFLANVLILVSLRKETSLHPPSKLLLRSLAGTDICVGLISEPLAVAYWLSVLNGYCVSLRYIYAVVFLTSIILCGVSLLTTTAISVDRLLALLLGLRYRQVVTLKRTYMIVITSWILPTIISTTYFWNFLIALRLIVIVILLCLVTSIFSYSKIFLTLRDLQTHVQNQPQQLNQTSPLNIARYKRAVSTALWLQLTLVACYLPRSIVLALTINNQLSSFAFLARQYTATLIFLNSSLNPLLYYCKVEEVRQAVKNTIRQMPCFSSQ